MVAPIARISAASLILLGLALWRPAPVLARPDVPAEIAATANLETLDADEVRYYQRQYRAKCSRCHGSDGAGGGEEAAQQAVPPANFTDAQFMSSRTDGQFFYQILMGGGERCAMPAFGPDSAQGWSEEKIWHMVAFIRRFAPDSDD